MSLDVTGLQHRLRHAVLHEAASARRAFEEAIAKSVPERVEAGDCADGLRLLEQANGHLRLQAAEFHAKFREEEALWLSDGHDIEGGVEVLLAGYDAQKQELLVTLDRWGRGDLEPLRRCETLCLDRRELGLERLLLEGLDAVFAPENAHVPQLLIGALAPPEDAGRRAEAEEAAAAAGFTAAQREAFARAVASEHVTLIQGPPGTGKTRVLAEIALHLAQRRCRVFVSAFTHRALDHLLLSIRQRSEQLPIFKITSRRADAALGEFGIRCVSKLERLPLPPGGVVVGGTPFTLRKRNAERRFHFVMIDEAGQMPLVHGAIAMTAARRVIVAGDPAQLPPVAQGEYRDEQLGASLHLHLQRHYDNSLLDLSYRLNTRLCEVVSSEFYAGRLRPAERAAGRRLRMPRSGEDALAEILAPEHPLVHARIDHLGHSRRSPEEATLIADLLLRAREAAGLGPESVAVLTPFRQQVRAIRSALESRGIDDPRYVVDTVERLQGQERELVLLSFAASDRDYLAAQAEFYFEPGRLCVAVSRARCKCILVGSRELLRVRPRALPQLIAAARVHRLLRACHVVDVSEAYGEHPPERSP